ncbi:hypothetical protein AB0M95_34045 [Sphaerisporangium sp. NPDC051017]|uniref:hypothetical protein n=1 Tax=Sphaerisporangium sp. NPDC051017 TaxID=3154636 RepID=UPI0034422C23
MRLHNPLQESPTPEEGILYCLPGCPNPERNRYLIHLAHRYNIPVCQSLGHTVTAALAIVDATITCSC